MVMTVETIICPGLPSCSCGLPEQLKRCRGVGKENICHVGILVVVRAQTPNVTDIFSPRKEGNL